jgi:sugar lactone lactonase YvrE
MRDGIGMRSVYRGLAAAAALLTWAAPASALEACPGPAPKTTVLLADQGLLESVIADTKGRLFFTGPDGLMRLDRRDAKPKLITPIDGGGGLAFDTDGKLVVGYGNTIQNGSSGDSTGPSGLYKVDPDTGKFTTFATGLSMANGVARTPDGSFYASNDVGHNIDRIVAGKTERGWSQVESGNGMAVDLTGRYLFVNQTFRPAAIARIDLAHPDQVTTFATPADPSDLAAGLDGMTIDAAGRLFSAANGAGQVWRANTDASLCLLLDGLPKFPDGPSAVAVGDRHGTFGAANLYVVTFGGQLIEIEGAVQPPARMRLRAPRRRVPACGRRGVTLAATSGSAPVAGATVQLAGAMRRTGRAGRVRFTAPFAGNGRYRAVAVRGGYETAAAAVSVVGC